MAFIELLGLFEPVSPESVEIGQEVNISITVANQGGTAGDYEVRLNISGAIID